MPFVPRYSREQVERLVDAGNLSLWQVYELEHQHPLNKATHLVGIPTILLSLAWPFVSWKLWGDVQWPQALGLNLFGWGLQFLGHRIEGNRPALFRDPRQMLIGPAFVALLPVLYLGRRLTGASALPDLPDPLVSDPEGETH